MELKLLITRKEIDAVILEVGKKISDDYAGKEFLIVGILKGCTVFMGQILPHIQGDLSIDFMTLSSYGTGTDSGDLKLLKDLDAPVNGRHVLLLEDIVDTGKTVRFVQEYLNDKGALSVEILALINKKQRRKDDDLYVKYFCFEYDQDEFLLGFGFDLNEKFRNLPDIYQLI